MNKTKVQLLLLPYDSGHRSLRVGRGPEHLLKSGLAEVLQSQGYEVSVETIESQRDFRAEVGTQFEIYGYLAAHVAEARQNGGFPLILSGNCGATLGAIAGARTERLGVIWFDAHGEFNTPETTTSGFLDGMGLAIATGLCWKELAASIPHFRPMPAAHALLVGGRDFDPGEKERLEQSGVMVVDYATIEQTGLGDTLEAPLSKLVSRVDEVHVHIDLDVLDPNEAQANEYVTEGVGLGVQQVSDAIALIRERSKITSATVASFDPDYDKQGKTSQVALEFIRQMVDS